MPESNEQVLQFNYEVKPLSEFMKQYTKQEVKDLFLQGQVIPYALLEYAGLTINQAFEELNLRLHGSTSFSDNYLSLWDTIGNVYIALKQGNDYYTYETTLISLVSRATQ